MAFTREKPSAVRSCRGERYTRLGLRSDADLSTAVLQRRAARRDSRCKMLIYA